MTEMEKRQKRCCFTGHRPNKLKRSEAEVKVDLARAVEDALATGKRTFITGMSRGTDIYAGEWFCSIVKPIPPFILFAPFHTQILRRDGVTIGSSGTEQSCRRPISSKWSVRLSV